MKIIDVVCSAGKTGFYIRAKLYFAFRTVVHIRINTVNEMSRTVAPTLFGFFLAEKLQKHVYLQ